MDLPPGSPAIPEGPAVLFSGTLGRGLTIGEPRDLALQALALLGAVLVSFLVRRTWNQAIERRITAADDGSPRVLTLRALKRVVFATTLIASAALVYGICEALGQPTGLIELAIPLAFVLAAVRIVVFLLRVAAGPGGGTRQMELGLSVVLWVLCALYLLGWMPTVASALDSVAMHVGEARFSLLGGIKLLVLSALAILIALALARMAEGRLLVKQALDSGVRVGLAKFIRYGLVAFAVLAALSGAGFDLTTLTVIGGTLGVGIGFGLQKVASNLVSGFLLLFDRSIRPGDVITIGESYGWVTKMGARYLVVRDLSGVDTLIPNEELITSQVKNWSYGDRHVRIKLPVQISYDDDPQVALGLMRGAATASGRVIADPPPVAHLLGFGDNGIDLQLSVWIDDPEQGINDVRSAINLTIWRSFEAHGITIPFPQRDLHLKHSPPGFSTATEGS
jgi:small-conductance mechanosensitive channel